MLQTVCTVVQTIREIEIEVHPTLNRYFELLFVLGSGFTLKFTTFCNTLYNFDSYHLTCSLGQWCRGPLVHHCFS